MVAISAKQTPFTRRTDASIRKLIDRRTILRPKECILAAISGGPDSTALLLALTRLRDKLGLELTAAHFNHKLRTPEEADGDAAFCESLCKSLNVPLTTGAGDVKRRVRTRGETVEEAARNLRYAFLGRAARERKASAIATGHTLDDRAETILLNIIRGAGLDGIAAMPPRSSWPFGKGPDIARPLLELSREDTARYCRESGIEPRRDPTNDLPIATRNRLRSEVVPLLRTFNPRISQALARLSDAAAGDAEFIDAFAESTYRAAASRDGETISVDRNVTALPDAIVRRLLRRAYRELAGEELDATHLDDVEQLLRNGRGLVGLPKDLQAIANMDTLRIATPREPAPAIQEKRLVIPGRTRASGWTITTRPQSANGARKTDPLEALIDPSALRPPLVIRSRNPGDRLRPLGLHGSKKVQDILVDAKVRLEERDTVPILADAEGPVWVVGHCIADRVKVTKGTHQVLRLRATRDS
jgi:tRNA(Ile)-lysidine synthase